MPPMYLLILAAVVFLFSRRKMSRRWIPVLACYLLCASCSERIASKLRNQDYCLPFIHSVSLQLEEIREIRALRQKEVKLNWEAGPQEVRYAAPATRRSSCCCSWKCVPVWKFSMYSLPRDANVSLIQAHQAQEKRRMMISN